MANIPQIVSVPSVVTEKLQVLLESPPKYGELSLTAIFRAGVLIRVETSKSEGENFQESSPKGTALKISF